MNLKTKMLQKSPVDILIKILKLVFWSTLIPSILVVSYGTGLIGLTTLKISLVIFLIVFVILPIIFKYSVSLQRGILFLNFVAYPRNFDYSNPEAVGLNGTRNLYVTYQDNNSDEETQESIILGVWHVLPQSLATLYEEGKNLPDVDVKLKGNKQNKADAQNNLLIGDVDTLDSFDYNLVNFNKGNIHLLKTNQQAAEPLNDKDVARKKFFENSLQLGKPVVLYLHGNSASRAAKHRVELYQMLRKLDYHVIAVDYRSYGDSCLVPPSELGVVNDALAVYKWVCSLTTGPIYVWGHSLGTGVSAHLLSMMNNKMVGPRALVLESPFNNIKDEISAHPMAKLFKHLPWFNMLIVQPMHANMLRFESDRHLNNFRQPVLILHAEDDMVVPFKLGHKLYRKAVEDRQKSWGPLEFHRFERSSHYGHKYICRDSRVPEIIQNFFETYQNVIYK